MRKTNLAKIIIILMMGMILVSCERNPMKRLSDPFDEGALNTWSGVFQIYNDDLITGGNVAFIPSDLTPPDNSMTIDFKVTDNNPPEGTKCLKYSWNGNDLWWDDATVPFKGYEHDWAGVSLIVATHWSLYDPTPSKDMSAAGYTKITFKARASLDSNDIYVKFEGPISTTAAAPRRGGTSTDKYLRLNKTELSDWQSYTINFNTADFKSVKDYFKIVIEYPKGINTSLYSTGGVVLVDDIRYER